MSAGISAFATETQKVMLDGEWNFATLAGDGSVSQSGKIKVPSAWEAQGYGKPTDKTNFNFVGVGRYEREFFLPETEKEVTLNLVLEGVSRYATIWINDKYIGESLGLTGSHRIRLDNYLKSGEIKTNAVNKIKIEVDSRQRMDFDAMLGAAQLNDYMNIVWGGLYGHVYIEILPKFRMVDLYVRSRISPARFITEAKLPWETKYPAQRLSCFGSTTRHTKDTQRPRSVKLEVFDADGKLVGSNIEYIGETMPQTGMLRVEAEVADAKLWSPESPYLYTLKMSLIGNDGSRLHSINWRAGIREITTGAIEHTRKPYQFLLNGKPFFLLGYGDDHIYVREFSMPADKKMYVERLKKIKALGFNHVRLHSTIMPPEYYEACDEVGIMPNAEFTIGYPWQMPHSRYWLKNAPHGSLSYNAYNFYKERFARAVKDYRNYTCIFAWVGGNELIMGNDKFDPKHHLLRDFENVVREHDPDRLFMDSDGDWAKELPDNIRPTMDFVSALYDEWADFADFGNKYVNPEKVGKPKLPIISHETANFCTFTRPEIIDFFKGSVFKPFWLTDSVKKLEAANMTQKANEWATASEKLAMRAHKHNIESLRKNPHISGYHWWLIQDYWTSSDGLFDYAFNLKRGIDAQTIRNINAPTVLLQNGLEFSNTDGEKMSAKILVSNFAQKVFNSPVKASLKSGGKTLAEFAPQKGNAVACGEVGSVAEFCGLEKFAKSDGASPRIYTLEVSADFDGKPLRNEWRFTVFPKNIKPAKKVYTKAEAAGELPEFWNATTVKSADGLNSGGVLFARELTADAVAAMQRGATVVLIRPEKLATARRMQYKSAWWRVGGSERTNHCGTFVEKNSPFAALAPENYCIESMAKLFRESRRFYVDEFKTKPETPITAISSMLMLKNCASVMITNVGDGVLAVSGLSHAYARSTPENAWALSVLADAKAATSTPVEEVKALVK